MISQELMLGDWVQFTSEQWLTEEDACPLKVTCVGEPKYPDFYPYIRIEGRNENYHIDLFQPIPLTPEILEKNGFEWHNNEAKYFPNTWCCGELMLEPIVNETLFLIVSRNDYDDEVTNYTPFTIKFVHELQHAIRLCGKEKEIEL